jgi:hypothetical protein
MSVYNIFFLHYMFEEWMTNRIYFLYLCLLTFLKFMILELNINRLIKVKLKFITISNNVKSSRDSLVTLYNYTQSLYKPSAFVVSLQDTRLLIIM